MITFDEYYNILEYQKIVDAMKHNDVDYREYVDIISSRWYVDIDNTPTHKYTKATTSVEHRLVQKTRGLTAIDKKHLERQTIANTNGLSRYISNNAINEAHNANYARFLVSTNVSDIIKVSKYTKVWWFGFYKGNRAVAMITEQIDPMLFAKDTKIIDAPPRCGEIDLCVNEVAFMFEDYLRKYTLQPYFEDGAFVAQRGKRITDY